MYTAIKTIKFIIARKLTSIKGSIQPFNKCTASDAVIMDKNNITILLNINNGES